MNGNGPDIGTRLPRLHLRGFTLLLLACLLSAGAAGAREYRLAFNHNLNVWTWDHEAQWAQPLSPEFRAQIDGGYTKRVSSVQFRSRAARGAADFTLSLIHI